MNPQLLRQQRFQGGIVAGVAQAQVAPSMQAGRSTHVTQRLSRRTA